MEERVLKILEEITEDIITYDGENMYDEGVISSIDVIEIISELENEFDIEIDASLVVADNFRNMDSIVEMMEGILGSCS